MADTTFNTVLPPLKAIDNGDGTFSLAVVIGGQTIPLPVLTTIQRNALIPSAGWIIWNSTTTQVEVYNGANWVGIETIVGSQTKVNTHATDVNAHAYGLVSIIRVGQYYIGFPCSALGSEAQDANWIRAGFCWIPRTMTFDRIAIEVTVASGAGTSCRLGIYNDDGAGYPNALVLDAGAMATDTTGIKAITINQQLTKGIYWLACLAESNPTLYYGIGFTSQGIDTTSLNQERCSWHVAQAYGALPVTFVAGAVTRSRQHCYLRVKSIP